MVGGKCQDGSWLPAHRPIRIAFLTHPGPPRRSPPMPTRLSRRRFLTHTAAVAGSLGVLPTILLAEKGKPSPNERLHVGVIGIGGMGGADMYGVADAGAEIVTLCDVVE